MKGSEERLFIRTKTPFGTFCVFESCFRTLAFFFQVVCVRACVRACVRVCVCVYRENHEEEGCLLKKSETKLSANVLKQNHSL